MTAPAQWATSPVTASCTGMVALAQSNLKRLLAYSSIAHVGYMLMGLVAPTPGSATVLGYDCANLPPELQGVLDSELASRKITYTRSDGSPWTLSVKDVVGRATEFEMAYNPNDCVELRWAAPDNSDEASTCKRHAPQAQRAKMSEYRSWFRDRHWPAHT